MHKTTVLMILDGYGINNKVEGNAIQLANTPNMDTILENYPNSLGGASGLDVGLPIGQMGNSEIGHTTIGAGRIIYSDLVRINKSIESKDFFYNNTLLQTINSCITSNKPLHIMGLLSDGGIHSHNRHLYALLKMAKDNNLSDVYIHVFLDGRDASQTSGLRFVKELQTIINTLSVGIIASISGRFYAMDRDNKWDRTKLTYDMLTSANYTNTPVTTLIENFYNENITDEFVPPTLLINRHITANDHIIFFNFRADRARQLTAAFCNPKFDNFSQKIPTAVHFTTFTDYDTSITNKHVVFEYKNITNALGEHLSKHGLKQLRIAETEKYPHVTFFFNGGSEEANLNEDRILIPSPMVRTYDLAPLMSADEITKKLIEAIKAKSYDFILVNYANADMVGHTGNIDATIIAIEYLDKCIGHVVSAIKDLGAQLFICADHGNAEKMLDPITKKPFTAHTTNQVPFIIINADNVKTLKNGTLQDVAPTILKMMGLNVPSQMEGSSLY